MAVAYHTLRRHQPSRNEEISYYYPTATLVTGPDIIFFWVARMIMAGYEYVGKQPFNNVYFTGIVRDSIGRKMSKMLGNSPDPLDLIRDYGADGVRMGLMLAAPAGNDIMYDDKPVSRDAISATRFGTLSASSKAGRSTMPPLSPQWLKWRRAGSLRSSAPPLPR